VTQNESAGIRLLKKGRLKLVRIIFSRVGLTAVMLILQILFFTAQFIWLREWLAHTYSFSLLVSSAFVLYVINTELDPTAKITWIIFIVVTPLFGALVYLYTKSDIGHRLLKKMLDKILSQKHLCQNEAVLNSLKTENGGVYSLSRYLNNVGGFNVYKNTKVTYFKTGKHKLSALLDKLNGAKEFIFLEYFIIDEGVMWGQILDVLARKVKEGVDVRVIYDGTNEFSTLPRNYPQRLKKLGIKCCVFSPITPFLSTHYNYRDHRKIAVIDGKTAFTGGINLADEYINEIEKYGRWKDCAVMLEGEATQSFTLMFLQMWQTCNQKAEDFAPYLKSEPLSDDGYVIPYNDNPLDSYRVGEDVYIDILSKATDYVYIMTPYLILDSEMENALKFASRRGVDVRIMLPGIPDKRLPYALAKTHYKALLKSGVKIYEYTPGFVHSKVFVSDDTVATVGSVNLDYRSFYHHFECGAYMYRCKCIADIKEDFLNTLYDCIQITPSNVKKARRGYRFYGFILKVVAPLL